MLKLGANRDPKGDDLGSQSTMSRLENNVKKGDLFRMAYALGDHFLDSFGAEDPEIICIDMDPTAHRVYGQQELALFNWKVDDYCLMPFHVYDGITGRLITAVMATIRPGKTPSHGSSMALPFSGRYRIGGGWPARAMLIVCDLAS